MSFSQFLIQQRKKIGLSQIALAQAVRISQPTIHHWEKGNRLPANDKLSVLAKALQISEQELRSALAPHDARQPHVTVAPHALHQQEQAPESSFPTPSAPSPTHPATLPQNGFPVEVHNVREVAFQGSLGAYSHQAIIDCFPYARVRGCESFERALQVVSDPNNASDLAMIPIENSQYGRVSDIHQLLPESPLYIIGEYFLSVKHMLLGTQGSKLEKIRTAISHHQALGQTRKTLSALNIKRERWSDTASAANEVAQRNDPTLAAIASEVAASVYGLKILRRRIEDHLDNITRFVIMSPRRIDPPPQTTETITSIFFTLRSIPSALYKCLGGFATQGVNIRKLESYVPFNENARASFYCEIEGNPIDKNVHQAMCELEYFTTRSRILGVYPANPFRPQRENLC